MAKAKGTTLLSLVKFLRAKPAIAREHLAPELHHYLEDRIQSAGWYPEEDLLGLLRCMLELMPTAREAALEQMGALVAREHLEGVYEHLLTEVSDLTSLSRRSFALWSTMHDTGRLAAHVEGSGEASFELRDYALPSPEMCSIMRGYFTETLRLGGGGEPTATETACRLRGAESCCWHVTWKPPDA